MKKTYVFFLVIYASINWLNAQTPVCLPDPIYKDSAAGIYPKPYDEITKTGGINKTACIDQDYFFPLTVRIPDAVVYLGITLGLERAILDTVKAVDSLPIGINYKCNPGNCVMIKNQLGCVVLQGKASSQNKPGQYNLLIHLILVTAIGPLEATFPGPFFPGSYKLTLAEKNSAACLTSPVENIQSELSNISAHPIPAKERLSISIFSIKPSESHLIIRDISGRQIAVQKISLASGSNEFLMPLQNFKNGSYTYSIVQGKSSVTKRFIVLH